MLPSHSWKWLRPRRSPKEIFGHGASSGGGPAGKGRGCLPMMDHLGDRLLLSVSANQEIIIGPGPGGETTDSTAILIGLLQGQLPLVESQIDLLKIAGEELSGKVELQVHKLTGELLAINKLLYKFGESQIKWGFNEFKVNKIVESIEASFAKIEQIAAPTGPSEGLLLPAVQSVREATTSLLGGLLKIDGGELSHKDQQTFLKISNSFLRLDQAILKTQEDLILERKAGGKQEEFLIVKMNDLLISSRISNPELQKELLGLADSTTGILIGLLQPPGTDDIITVTD